MRYFDKKMLWLFGALYCSVSTAEVSNNLVKTKPLFGNFHGTGMEVAIPFFRLVDSDANGIPDQVLVRHKIYAMGTTSLVGATPQRILPFPPIPAGCTDPAQIWVDFVPYPRRRPDQLNDTATFVSGSKRVHMGMNFSVECVDPATSAWNESYSAAVYSSDMRADLSGVAPTPTWVKYYSDAELLGLHGIDTNADLITDKLIITVSKFISDTSENAVVIPVNGVDGTADIDYAAKAYAVSR